MTVSLSSNPWPSVPTNIRSNNKAVRHFSQLLSKKRKRKTLKTDISTGIFWLFWRRNRRRGALECSISILRFPSCSSWKDRFLNVLKNDLKQPQMTSKSSKTLSCPSETSSFPPSNRPNLLESNLLVVFRAKNHINSHSGAVFRLTGTILVPEFDGCGGRGGSGSMLWLILFYWRLLYDFLWEEDRMRNRKEFREKVAFHFSSSEWLARCGGASGGRKSRCWKNEDFADKTDKESWNQKFTDKNEFSDNFSYFKSAKSLKKLVKFCKIISRKSVFLWLLLIFTID